MDKIKQIYSEVKSLKTIAKMYNDTKNQIKELEMDVEEMKQMKRSLDFSNLYNEIVAFETQLQEVTKEIDSRKLIECTCLTISDLKTVLQNIRDEKIRTQKCIDFIKTLFVSFNISKNKARELFCIEKECSTITVLKIGQEIEEVLGLEKNENVIRNEVTRILNTELDGTAPFDCSFFTADGYIIILFPGGNNNEEDIYIKNPKLISTEQVYQQFQKTTEIMFSVLKNNLSHLMIRDEYTNEDVIANNNCFKGTSCYIENTDEWIIDILVRSALKVTKIELNEDFLCETHDELCGKFISERYAQMVKFVPILTRSLSKRKEKAQSIIGKYFLKIFEYTDNTTIREMFIIYSDITHFIKKIKFFDISDQIATKREDLFYKIVQLATTLHIDLDNSVLMIKSKIKQKQFDFDENTSMFIANHTQDFFKCQFFEKLFDNFINFVKKPKKFNKSEKSTLNEIGKYLIDISYGLDPNTISNYKKIISLCKLVTVDLEETVSIYENDRIEFTKDEMRAFIRNFYDESAAREKFIDQLL